MLHRYQSYNRKYSLSSFIISTTAVAISLCILPSLSKADDVQDHFNKGLKFYNEKNLTSSLDEFNIALKGAPKDATILRWIGFLNLEKQNYQSAREPLEQAVTIDPNSVVAHLNLGNVYDGLKLYPKAISEFKTVARLKPGSPDAYFNMGLLYTKLGRWSDAVDSLRSATKLDEDSVKDHNLKISSDKDKARIDPYIQDALGWALLNMGSTKEALTSYQKAVALSPDSPAFNFHLGIAWRKAGENKLISQDVALANARKSLKVAAGKSPDSYDITERYGEALFDLNENASAIEQFLRASNLDKTQYNPVFNLGVAYSRLGDYPKSEEAYAKALTLIKPDDSKTRKSLLNNLSLVQYKQNKIDDALVNLKILTTDFPSETVGWVNLASCYRSKNNEEGEIKALKGAVENGNGYKNLGQIHAALGSIYYRRKDFPTALQHYVHAKELQSNNAETLNGLALTEQQLGKLEEAIKHFIASTKANPKFADAFNNLGVAYESRFNTSLDKLDLDKAQQNYAKALAADPGNSLAKKNKERLELGRKKI